MELTIHQKQIATMYSIISAIVQDKNTPEILKIGILNTLNEQLDMPEAGFVEDEETYHNIKHALSDLCKILLKAERQRMGDMILKDVNLN
jgi:uncharacterized protein (UPF0147 family)